MISPVAVKIDIHLIGSEQKGVGYNVSYGTPNVSPLSYRGHYGETVYWDSYDESFTGKEIRKGGEWSIGGGLTYSGTEFISGETSQTTNMFTLGLPGGNIKYENDMYNSFSLPGVPTAHGDEYRTAAGQLNAGPVTIGFNIFTRKPGKKEMIDGQEYYTYYEDSGNDPDKYRSGVIYLGIGNFRIGRNTEQIRAALQNQLVHSRTGSPYFHELDGPNEWYWYYGTETGNTMW